MPPLHPGLADHRLRWAFDQCAASTPRSVRPAIGFGSCTQAIAHGGPSRASAAACRIFVPGPPPRSAMPGSCVAVVISAGCEAGAPQEGMAQLIAGPVPPQPPAGAAAPLPRPHRPLAGYSRPGPYTASSAGPACHEAGGAVDPHRSRGAGTRRGRVLRALSSLKRGGGIVLRDPLRLCRVHAGAHSNSRKERALRCHRWGLAPALGKSGTNRKGRTASRAAVRPCAPRGRVPRSRLAPWLLGGAWVMCRGTRSGHDDRLLAHLGVTPARVPQG